MALVCEICGKPWKRTIVVDLRQSYGYKEGDFKTLTAEDHVFCSDHFRGSRTYDKHGKIIKQNEVN